MALPPLATAADVDARAPDLTADAGQVAALLDDASIIVRRFAGQDWVDENDQLVGVPDGVAGVCARMVVRALRNPQAATQETTGPFNVSYGAAAGEGLYLTRNDKLVLRGRGAFTVPQSETADGFLGGGHDGGLGL